MKGRGAGDGSSNPCSPKCILHISHKKIPGWRGNKFTNNFRTCTHTDCTTTEDNNYAELDVEITRQLGGTFVHKFNKYREQVLLFGMLFR